MNDTTVVKQQRPDPREMLDQVTGIIEDAGAVEAPVDGASFSTNNPSDAAPAPAPQGQEAPNQVPRPEAAPEMPAYTAPDDSAAPTAPPVEMDKPSPILQHHLSEMQNQQQQLAQDRQTIEQLARTDPAQASIHLQHWNQRAQQFQQYQQSVTQAAQQEFQTVQEGYRQRLTEKITSYIPAWKDGAVREREKAGLRKYLRSRGYTDKEINTTRDPRAIRDAYDQWKASTGTKSPAKKRKQVGVRQNLDQKTASAIKDASIRGGPHKPAAAVSNLLKSLNLG